MAQPSQELRSEKFLPQTTWHRLQLTTQPKPAQPVLTFCLHYQQVYGVGQGESARFSKFRTTKWHIR